MKTFRRVHTHNMQRLNDIFTALAHCTKVNTPCTLPNDSKGQPLYLLKENQ
jgi:hypothetical protein